MLFLISPAQLVCTFSVFVLLSLPRDAQLDIARDPRVTLCAVDRSRCGAVLVDSRKSWRRDFLWVLHIESPSMTILREYHSRWEGLVEIQVLRTPPKVLAWRSWNWPVLIGGAWMKAHVTLAGCSSEVLAKDILLNSFRRSFYDDVAGFLRRSCLKGLDIFWPSSCRGWCAKILWRLYWNRFRGPCMNWRCLSEMLIWKLLREAFRIFLSKDLVGPLEGPPMTIWQGSLCLKVLTKFS